MPGDPNVYYAATASGGVWKSVDGGASFNPIFDEQPVASMGAVAVAASIPTSSMWARGKPTSAATSAPATASTSRLDAGRTWTHVWTQEGQIGQLVVHPKNADIAFAACSGTPSDPIPSAASYRTSGKTWQLVLKKDEKTGASAVVFDPSNPNVLFAGLWQARRYPWDLTSGGPGSGLYVSRDGGDTWKQLTGNGCRRGSGARSESKLRRPIRAGSTL